MTDTIQAVAAPETKRRAPAKPAAKATPAAKAKQAAKKPTPTTKPKPKHSYTAAAGDVALMKGGSIVDIAKQFGTTPGHVRTHIKYRVASGKWKLEQTGDHVKLVKVEV
jgi:pyruvate/2-oxoglutarate dehydrogenase complex dihydrolipoamide acyltransferase (E2) component